LFWGINTRHILYFLYETKILSTKIHFTNAKNVNKSELSLFLLKKKNYLISIFIFFIDVIALSSWTHDYIPPLLNPFIGFKPIKGFKRGGAYMTVYSWYQPRNSDSGFRCKLHLKPLCLPLSWYRDNILNFWSRWRFLTIGTRGIVRNRSLNFWSDYYLSLRIRRPHYAEQLQVEDPVFVGSNHKFLNLGVMTGKIIFLIYSRTRFPL